MDREQTTIRLPKNLKEKLSLKAAKIGVPIKDLLIFIIYRHFENTAPK